MTLFRKITPCNGFDCDNPDNARQNNYAWSMAELDNYLYVGTSRNVLVGVLGSGLLPGLRIPPEYVPMNIENTGEIWRFPLRAQGAWERVYKAPVDSGFAGFRAMIRYTTPAGKTALYALPLTTTKQLSVLMSEDGVDWTVLPTGIQGSSTRSIIVHNQRLYLSVLPENEITNTTALLYTTQDPSQGWELVNFNGDANRNPSGSITEMASFNNKLYVATAKSGGFELWRTEGTNPELNAWKLVIDKGAGDALNEAIASMTIFNNQLYLGTAMYLAVVGIGNPPRLLPPKGFDIVRVNSRDRWQIVVGGAPIVPTVPTTGSRSRPISGLSSGFGNLTNAYAWQLRTFRGELYVGSFDWSGLLQPILGGQIESSPLAIPGLNPNNLITMVANYFSFLLPQSFFMNQRLVSGSINRGLNNFVHNRGFDLWKTRDGIRWHPITLSGLGNPNNYGARTLFVSSTNRLFLGTANPLQGAEVWVAG